MDNAMFTKWLGILDPKPAHSIIADLFSTLSTMANADDLLTQAVNDGWTAEQLQANLDSAPSAPAEAPAVVAAAPAEVAAPAVTSRGSQTRADKKRAQKAGKSGQGSQPAKSNGGNLFSNLVGRLRTKKTTEAAPAQDAAEPTGKMGLKVNKKMLIIGGAVLGVVLLAVVLIAFLGGSGGGDIGDVDWGSGAVGTEVAPTGEGQQPVPESVNPVDPNAANAQPQQTEDQQFWFGLKAISVPELSPGNMGGQLNAKTAIGIFLMVILTVFAYFEGKSRNKSGQNQALMFSMAGVMAGWFAMPLLAYMADASIGMFVVAALTLAVLWVLAISTIFSQSDLTPFTVALAVFTAMLFYYGKLEVVTTIGTLFGKTWNSWFGVTTLGGALTLLMTGRASSATLTVLIFFMGLGVIYLACRETGKKHGKWGPYLIGLAIVVLFYLANFGLNAGVNYLVTTQQLTVLTQVVLKVIAPLIAWFVSLLGSVLIGAALGDVEVGFTENKQKIGIQKQGTFFQNMSDFLILGTIVPLFLGVIIVF